MRIVSNRSLQWKNPLLRQFNSTSKSWTWWRRLTFLLKAFSFELSFIVRRNKRILNLELSKFKRENYLSFFKEISKMNKEEIEVMPKFTVLLWILMRLFDILYAKSSFTWFFYNKKLFLTLKWKKAIKFIHKYDVINLTPYYRKTSDLKNFSGSKINYL